MTLLDDDCGKILTSHVLHRRVTTFAYGLNFDAECPENGFHLISSFASAPHSLKLQGSDFFATDPDNCISIYDVHTGDLKYLLRVPLLHNDQTIFLEV